jgi:hypothetical protein
MKNFFGITFVPSAAKPPDPPSARKFFASSALNRALSLRFRASATQK